MSLLLLGEPCEMETLVSAWLSADRFPGSQAEQIEWESQGMSPTFSALLLHSKPKWKSAGGVGEPGVVFTSFTNF